MTLNQSLLNELAPSVSLVDGAWQIRWQRADGLDHTDSNSAQGGAIELVCEHLSGQKLREPISLPGIEWRDSESVDISMDTLAQASGLSVDQYAHPVFSLAEESGARFRVAPRPVPMTATANFRDYGGYVTADGRQVVWGKLFRTGHMGEMSAADKSAIEQLNIQTVCDFRRLEEAENQPSQLPGGLGATSIVISPGSAIDLFSTITAGDVNEEIIDQFMQDINRDLAINHKASYRLMFDELIAKASSGSIIHCTAGKDRTGFAGLLILGALGISHKDIMEDYMRTNEHVNIDREVARWTSNYANNPDYNSAPDDGDGGQGGTEKGSAEKGGAESGGGRAFNQKALAVILGVKSSYLQAAFDVIESQYQGLEAYLHDEIKLTPSEMKILKDNYLYS